MKDQSKTKQVLIQELASLKQRIVILERREHEYRFLSENMADMAFMVDMDLATTYVSPSIERILGFSPDERITQGIDEQLTPKSQKLVFETLAVELEQEKAEETDPNRSHTLELEYYHKDGSVKYLETYIRGNRDSEGNLTGFYGLARDISDRKRAEQALREGEEHYRALFDRSLDSVFSHDFEGRFIDANDAALNLLGYKREEISSLNFASLLSEDQLPLAFKTVQEIREKGFQKNLTEYRLRLRNGNNVYVETTGSAILSQGTYTAIQSVARDITERKRMEAELRASEEKYRELSIVDDLTELYNSRHFYQQLKMEIDRVDRYGQPLTLLLLDLDDFKQFNDTYGHIEGDQVLARFGQVVKRCLRQTDSAYRYGGEEFTILLPMTTIGDGAVTAERIRAELREEIFSPVSGKDVHMTVSIGLAQYKTREEMKAFVNRVDQLMYQAKKNGKDRVCPESY